MPEPIVRDVPRIFLSHSCVFDWFIHEHARYLESRGIKPYVAEWDHQDGRNVDEKTDEALLASDGVIVAWTKSAAVSRRVQREYDLAQQNHVPTQLLLPKRGVDRPASWGHREFVRLDIGRPFPPSLIRRFIVRNYLEVRTRTVEFSRKCLDDANARAKPPA